eukprot:COSAG01_NODE_3811_length_5675_cov_6.241930_6_plen_61_part_00
MKPCSPLTEIPLRFYSFGIWFSSCADNTRGTGTHTGRAGLERLGGAHGPAAVSTATPHIS